MIKAIIFDYFGVVRPDVLMAAYQKFGGDLVRDAQFISDTIRDAHRGLIPSSREVFAKRLGVSMQDWMAAFESKTGNDQQLLDFIRTLRPSYKIGLLSNVSRGGLKDLFTPAERKLFDAVVASGDIGYAKPEAQAYEIVADRLGVLLNECVFTDDRAEYCEAARAVGMQAILYQSFEQMKRELLKIL